MKRPGLIPTLITLALLCSSAGVLSAQTGVIRGTVTDSATRRPVEGVQVQLVGSTRGAVTDSAGEY